MRFFNSARRSASTPFQSAADMFIQRVQKAT